MKFRRATENTKQHKHRRKDTKSKKALSHRDAFRPCSRVSSSGRTSWETNWKTRIGEKDSKWKILVFWFVSLLVQPHDKTLEQDRNASRWFNLFLDFMSFLLLCIPVIIYLFISVRQSITKLKIAFTEKLINKRFYFSTHNQMSGRDQGSSSLGHLLSSMPIETYSPCKDTSTHYCKIRAE